MSVPPRRGLNRRPARGFGQKKDSSLGKPPSKPKKKRYSISDAFKRGEERRRIRKIKREQQKKLRGKSTKSPLVVEPKRPKTPKITKTLNKTGRRKVPGVKAPGSGTRVRRGLTKGRGILSALSRRK
tara:strand:- start:163 stop:543 length:381 start_codon:yes stop_codon:yes gene_type:complete